MERDSFVFYRSFYEGIKELPRDIQGEVLTAIMEYGLNGVTTENLKPVAKAIVTLIKPQIEANNKKFENGKLGGAPEGNQNARKNNQKTTKNQPKNNQKQPNVNDNDNVNDNVKEEEEKKEKALPQNFKKLTIHQFHEELKSYTSDFSKETVSAFFNYWTEKDSIGKMRFQREETWETKKRLIMWKNKEAKWKS